MTPYQQQAREMLDRHQVGSLGDVLLRKFCEQLVIKNPRNLERERDEARYKWDSHQCNIDQAELTQLRKVCDELAKSLKNIGDKNPNEPVWEEDSEQAVIAYSQLPHVKAKEQKCAT